MTPHALLAPARLAGQPILRTQSDERLVDLVRAGSEPAFEAIVARYQRPLLRYCARILPEERAEDAVQQTFVRAYRAMSQSDSELHLRPWLYRIAHNTALNALRDRGLRHEELEEELDTVERPDEVLERSQGLRAVLNAVQELPERQRDAIVLRELEGRSYDEIAAELGVSGGAVRQLLNRARNTLRRAATALTPPGLAMRIPWSGGEEAVAVRVAELCGGTAGGAVVAKVCATALVTGAVVGGGVAVGPDVVKDDPVAGVERPGGRAPVRETESSGPPGGDLLGVAPAPDDRGGRGSDDSSGRGSGDDGDGSSGSGSGSSGSGSSGSGSSGSGSSGSGSSGSGSYDTDNSGSGSSGSGSSGSGSSGSGSYDSDNSGSGSYSSGSGSSGSGSSGSGSSGSGSYDSDNSGSGSSGSGSSGSGSSGSGSSGSGSSGSGSSGSGSSGSGDYDSDDSGSGSSGSGSSGSGSSGSGSE